jgi:uncharacterized protein DUF3606
MTNLIKRQVPDRSKINVHEPREARCWAHELGVSREQLRKLVEKVGNSAAAVRKELETSGRPQTNAATSKAR